MREVKRYSRQLRRGWRKQLETAATEGVLEGKYNKDRRENSLQIDMMVWHYIIAWTCLLLLCCGTSEEMLPVTTSIT